jgi:hypothetical protein
MENAKPAQPAPAASTQPASVSPAVQNVKSNPVNPDGIRAEVKAKVKVESKGGLHIHLDVVAINLSGADIHLRDPYEIRVKDAGSLSASAYLETAGSTQNVFSSAEATDLIRVHFKDQSVWKNQEKLHIEIAFEAAGLFEVEGELLFGPYSIKPVATYQTIPITNHKFEYLFVFKTPTPKKLDEILAWLFKANEVLQTNSRRINPSKLRLPWQTTMQYSFDATKDQDLKITFAREYKFWSVLSAAALFVLGCIIEFVAHDYVTSILEKIKAHYH